MTTGMRGLTGGSEVARIILGRKPSFDNTSDGKIRVKFSGAFGTNDIDNLKFATWRFCVAYGKEAENLRHADKGSLVLYRAWITTEAELDTEKHPVIEDGKIRKKECRICDYTKLLVKDVKEHTYNINEFKQEHQLNFINFGLVG